MVAQVGTAADHTQHINREDWGQSSWPGAAPSPVLLFLNLAHTMAQQLTEEHTAEASSLFDKNGDGTKGTLNCQEVSGLKPNGSWIVGYD